MARYVNENGGSIEAHQWFRNGDHPGDRPRAWRHVESRSSRHRARRYLDRARPTRGLRCLLGRLARDQAVSRP